MVPLEKETNIEVLRHISLWMRDQIEDLVRENQQIKKLNEEEKQAWLNQEMKEQLLKLQERFYGRGRENLDDAIHRPVGHSQMKLNLHGESESSKKKEEDDSTKVPLSSTTYTYQMSERELKAQSLVRGINAADEAWEKMPGFYQSSTMITVIERIYQQELHQQQKYRLKAQFNTSDKEVIVTAPGPARVRPGSKYSIDFAVTVVSDKYLYHLPLERQRRQMEAQGLKVEVKTLYGLCEAVAEHCNVIIPKIKKEILNDFCAVHLDETPWHILGSDQTHYMWALSNRIGSFYQFEPTRSGKIAEEILGDYEGSVVTDGYGGYNGVKKNPQVRVGQCWSHVRREFLDIEKSYPTEVLEIITIIDKLFDIEAKAKTFDELRELRRTESQDVIKEIYKWIFETRPKHFPRSGIVKAIDYCLKFWLELTWFLKDLSVPLTNNDAERALRHVVMGRKNFNGSKTINGADTAASLYTVIESAKKAGLNPSDYLKYLIDARWFNDELKTPQELAKEKHKKKSKVAFPPVDQWQVH